MKQFCQILLLLVSSLGLLSVNASTQSATATFDSLGETSVSFHHQQQQHLAATTLSPVSLEGIELPVHHEVDGKLLYRNGHGLRSFRMYGVSLKMYVASFYSATQIRDEKEVLECSGCPLLFHFTFLRSVGQGKVKFAWQKQLDYSVSYFYDGYEQDRDAFVDMFGAMEYQGSVTVKFVGDQTLVLDQGVLKGSITGEDFQRAFLSMWFGERAVQDDLKLALLGNSSNEEDLAIVA